jgi:hypothetical protein
MKSLVVIFSVLTIFSGVIGCKSKTWTDKQRKEFEDQCLKTETFSNMIVLFQGFENTEFDSVSVIEYSGNQVVDSFKIDVPKAENPTDKERKERSASISREMNIKYSYHFRIPGHEPYVLSEIKMVMWPQYTNDGEGWGCQPGDFKIDGQRFEKNANPTFVKRK